MRTVIVIPARLKSSRLPNKLLLDLGGKSIIRRVYEQCLKVEEITNVYIAVDDEKLKLHCEEFTENTLLTSKNHQSGTDRIAEAVSQIDCEAVINVQGDEPFIDPVLISEIAKLLQTNTMVSAMCPIFQKTEIEDPNNVKVVVNKNKKAIYFSRSVIPFNRDGIELDILKYYKHLGVYGYTKKILFEFTKLKPTYLEEVEKLEQLRVIENGFKIHMIETCHNAIGIDTQEDYNNAKELMK